MISDADHLSVGKLTLDQSDCGLGACDTIVMDCQNGFEKLR